MMELLVNEGFSWHVISEIWEGKVTPYTQSLDAGIEGENIAFAMKSERREQWAAVHKAADGTEHVAWARTEILARRLAALKGILAEAGRHAGDPMTSGADEDAEEGPADLEPLVHAHPDRTPAHMGSAAPPTHRTRWTALFQAGP